MFAGRASHGKYAVYPTNTHWPYFPFELKLMAKCKTFKTLLYLRYSNPCQIYIIVQNRRVSQLRTRLWSVVPELRPIRTVLNIWKELSLKSSTKIIEEVHQQLVALYELCKYSHLGGVWLFCLSRSTAHFCSSGNRESGWGLEPVLMLTSQC